MPLKNGRLTPRELAFAATYARTGDTAYSSEKAGFATMSAGTQALTRPMVRGEIERRFAAELRDAIVPLTLKRHRQILEDPTSTGPTLVRALELGYRFGLKAIADDEQKDLGEMTLAELTALIRRGTVTRAEHEDAKLIEGTFEDDDEADDQGESEAAGPSIFD